MGFLKNITKKRCEKWDALSFWEMHKKEGGGFIPLTLQKMLLVTMLHLGILFLKTDSLYLYL